MSRHCVLVTGMHRSGTSMHAGMIKILGADMGVTLGPKPGVNDKGFFEHKRIMRNNQYLLESLGMSWDSSSSLGQRWLERTKKFELQARNLVEESFGESKLFCIKDPRICRMLKMWLPLLDNIGVTTSVILCVRHPEDVYGSLSKRGEISRDNAMSLWSTYYGDFLRDIDRSYTVLEYNKTVEDPSGYLCKIASSIGLHNVEPTATDESIEFVSEELKHSDVGGTIQDQDIHRIYNQLMEEAL